jgi:hypothetical protein
MHLVTKNLLLDRLVVDYLTTSGWIESIRNGESMDLHGPVPWITYSAARYLSRIVQADYRVLEFGAGNSTRWWAERVSEVVSVEHDPNWAEAVRKYNLKNVTLVERAMGDPVSFKHSEVLLREFYPLQIAAKESADPTKNYRAGLIDHGFHSYASVLLDYPVCYFNIIVVDGMARVLTAWLASRQLADDGMIIFDNSDRNEYIDAYQYLEQAGFARIDFSGIGPLNTYEWCTSMFVKSLRSLAPRRL